MKRENGPKRILSVVALLTIWAFSIGAIASELHWTVTQHTYEGLPLFTRYPVNLDYDKSMAELPIRMTASLTLSRVTAKGLPEAKYNTSLEPLDNFIIEYFHSRGEGQCVLVETFNGQRHFYVYIAERASVDEFRNALVAKFPAADVKVSVFRDPNWSFIKKYAAEYLAER